MRVADGRGGNVGSLLMGDGLRGSSSANVG